MSRLFSANMMRLKKSRILLLEEIIIVGYTLIIYNTIRSTIEFRGSIENWNAYFFNGLIYAGFLMALFVSFYLGAEYGDGTIRNKLMVGLKRRDIYLVNYVTCLLAGLIMCATYYLSALIFGCLIVGKESLQVQNIGMGIFCSILVYVVYTAIYVLVEMLDQNKARSIAINFIAALLILVIGMESYSELVGHPDTVGFMWHIIELLFPSVLVLYSAAGAEKIPYVPIVLGLLIETACLTGIGIWGFGRKDIQ